MTTSSPIPTRSGDAHAPVEIVARPYDHPDSVRLVEALFEEQVGRYGSADPVVADPGEYTAPRGIFLIAYAQGRPAGCGGAHWLGRDSDVVELKKMYTVPDLRRHGVARLLLAQLEAYALGQGARCTILETGVRSHAALALVASAGYRLTARYVAGRDPAINRAFTKTLA